MTTKTKNINPQIIKIRGLFGKNFKKARKSANLSQSDIQKITGIQQAFLSNVERGKTKISLDTMIILSLSINVPLWQLLVPQIEQ